MQKKALILLSGGLDSTTVLAVACSEGYECHCISFVYGQRHALEIDFARKIAKLYDVKSHVVANADLSIFSGSSLTSDMQVPKHDDLSHLHDGVVPSTYVPGRNTIFLSYAFAYAESMDINNIFIGCNAIDYSNYPDCRPEYIEAFELLMNRARARVSDDIKIHAPLLHLAKSEIIILGNRLGVDYSLTSSCYSPNAEGVPCGCCDACLLRKGGFADAGMSDPLEYMK